MTWHHSYPEKIDSYASSFHNKYKHKHDILLKAGTRIQTGHYSSDLYLKPKRDGTFVLNHMYRHWENAGKHKIIVRKIGTMNETHFIIPKPGDWAFKNTFSISALKARTKSTEHQIFRQDSIKGLPETKIRSDRPLYINVNTNHMFQKHPLKVRHFDRALKKRYKDFAMTFKHEFSVIHKLGLYEHYMGPRTEAHRHNVIMKPIKIKRREYLVQNYQTLYTCLFYKKWFDIKLTKQDRLNLAMFTLLQQNCSSYNYDYNMKCKQLSLICKDLAEDPWKRFFNYSQLTEEKWHLKTGVATYKEQDLCS